jgi:ribosome-associated translation inhibitor RaiA
MISCADVEDLLEEMVQRTLDDTGQTAVMRDAPFSIAAKPRFPVSAQREPTMKVACAPGVRVETRGRVPEGSADLAAAKVSSLLQIAAEPVLSARVTVAVSADPAVERPAVAQATIDLNSRVVRAQAAGRTVRTAIEQMASRLQVRLGRTARSWAALRGTIPAAEPGQWRHQSIPADRPLYFPRPGDQRAVISHASYAARPETPEEAAAELVLLDYDFHLFTERSTGQDSVIYRTPGGYRLAMAHPKPGRLGPLPDSVAVSSLPAPRLTVLEATDRLDAAGQPFTFFVDAETGRGSLVYHRYDGHYGLVVPAGVRH